MDARTEFLALMRHTNERIEQIDDVTPWSDSEPKWWLDMMNIQRAICKAIAKHEDTP